MKLDDRVALVTGANRARLKARIPATVPLRSGGDAMPASLAKAAWMHPGLAE